MVLGAKADRPLDPIPSRVPPRDREMLTVSRLDVITLPQQGESATGTGADEATPARFQIEFVPRHVPRAGGGRSP